MKRHLSTIFLVVILLTGLSLLLYPTVSDYWNSFHQSRAIANYSEQVKKMDRADYGKILADAHAYNEQLLHTPDRYHMTGEERARYNALLNVSGTGIMGYIEIPDIGCRLPIYHGMDEEVLQIAAGHLEGTSLPVGGKGTHAVLAAHRGLPSARLFTDLDQMKEGDVFIIRVLNETMTYEVDQIRIVLPEELSELEIESGKDYCTLATCTPYGVNSHRMLVRGIRTANREMPDAGEGVRRIKPYQVVLCTAVPILLISAAWAASKRRRKRRK